LNLRRQNLDCQKCTSVLCYKFYTQVVQVYLQPFWRNSLWKCVLQPKIAKY